MGSETGKEHRFDLQQILAETEREDKQSENRKIGQSDIAELFKHSKRGDHE
jgi:hypothetical protein